VRWKLIYFACFTVLANIPDFPIPYWGHHKYGISHSLFVNLLIMTILFSLINYLPFFQRSFGNKRIMPGAMCAWLSHLLLDTFYNHGHGLAMFWPFSQAHLALPLPWFSVVPFSPPPFTRQHLRIYAIEWLAYFPIFIIQGTRKHENAHVAGIRKFRARGLTMPQ
jgi:membrane-bound metal-dependent hydrolase YbcI (DUF457 family)